MEVYATLPDEAALRAQLGNKNKEVRELRNLLETMFGNSELASTTTAAQQTLGPIDFQNDSVESIKKRLLKSSIEHFEATTPIVAPASVPFTTYGD